MAQVHAGFPTPGIELGMTTVLFFLIVIFTQPYSNRPMIRVCILYSLHS